jgi:hypothetical protein
VTLAHAVADPSLVALRLSAVVLAAVNAVLGWRLAARLLPPVPARTAGLLLWVGPPAALWLGVRQMLFYQPTVTLGLVLGLLAFGVRSQRRARVAAAAVLVLGLWTSPNIVYFALPAAVVVWPEIPRWWSARPRPARRAAVVTGLVAAGLGTDALWARVLPERGSFPVLGTYAYRLWWFAAEGLPSALGFGETLTHRWILGPAGVAAYLAVLVVLGRRWGRDGAGWTWDRVGLVTFPFLFALLPFGPDQPNLRYLFFAVPFVALALARAVPSPAAGAVAVGLTVAVTVVGLARLTAVSAGAPPGAQRVGQVGDLGPVVAALDRRGVRAAYADYWIAYRLTYESGDRIVGAPSWGLDRDPATSAAGAAADRPAWVAAAGAQADALAASLSGLGVAAEVEPVGELVVVVPGRPVRPTEVDDRARHL